MKPNLPPKQKSQETETRCNWTGPWQWDQQKILKIPFCWESDIPSNNNDNKEEVSLISGFFIIFALLVLPLKCRHAHFLSLSHIVFSAFFNAPIFQTTTFYAVSTQQAISVPCQWCMHYPYIMLENASATTNIVWKTKDLCGLDCAFAQAHTFRVHFANMYALELLNSVQNRYIC